MVGDLKEHSQRSHQQRHAVKMADAQRPSEGRHHDQPKQQRPAPITDQQQWPPRHPIDPDTGKETDQ